MITVQPERYIDRDWQHDHSTDLLPLSPPGITSSHILPERYIHMEWQDDHSTT